MRYRSLGQLGNVDQAFNTIFDLSKGAKIHHIGDHTFEQLPQFILVLDLGPGFRQQAFQAQANPLFLDVQT